jgi:predicted metal-dependent hydrolase
MAKIRHESWPVGNIHLPVRIYSEWRSNRRISIGKGAVFIRLPVTVSLSSKASWRKWALHWLKEQFLRNPSLKSRFISPIIRPGQIIKTTFKAYQLKFAVDSRKHPVGKVSEDVVQVCGHNAFFADADHKLIQRIIEKAIGNDQLDWLTFEVERLNDLFFKKPYSNVRIKHNSSNWGSCSASGNINISFRALLTPKEIIDYVIVHELAHLSEMNHSERFWKLVGDAIPDYRSKDQWLRTKGRRIHLQFEDPLDSEKII